MRLSEMKKPRESVKWAASETVGPRKYLLTYKSIINQLKCTVNSNYSVFCICSSVRRLRWCDKMRCCSSLWFSRMTDSVVHFLSACPKSVFGMFVADHVDQADIEKCTTGSEHSTYSIWEMRGIQGSSGKSVAIFFFFSFFFASGQFEFIPGKEWKKRFLQ